MQAFGFQYQLVNLFSRVKSEDTNETKQRHETVTLSKGWQDQKKKI